MPAIGFAFLVAFVIFPVSYLMAVMIVAAMPWVLGAIALWLLFLFLGACVS